MSRRTGQRCAKPSCPRVAKNGGLCRPHYELTIPFEVGRVDPAPVVAHIKALAKAGIGTASVSRLTGIWPGNLRTITSGKSKYILARTAAKIMAVPVPAAAWSVAGDHCRVPAIGTRRRLRALMAIGYSSRDIADQLGLHQAVVSRISSGLRPEVTARIARQVAILFDKLQMTPGPNAHSRRHAAAKGWQPPFAWDEGDIDNPSAKPCQQALLSTEEFFIQYEKWRARGYDNAKIAAVLGIRLRSLEKRLWRARKRESAAA